MKNKTLSYFIAVVGVAITATLGGIFTNMGVDMLDVLNLPTEWIGGTVISIVWTIIYTALALYLILIIANNQLTTKTVILAIANSVANVAWCGVFFALGSLLGGLIIIIINAILAVLLVLDATNKKPLYSYTAIYPLWVAVATCLNLAIWILN